MAIDFGKELVKCGGKWRGDCLVDLPSRTLKPMSDQSIVFTGGGGKVIVSFRRSVLV